MQYVSEACSEELHTFFCHGKFAAQAIFKPTRKYLLKRCIIIDFYLVFGPELKQFSLSQYVYNF